MGVDFFAGINWRDIVLVAAAMIGVYLVLTVMRLVKVSGKRGAAAPLEGKAQFSGWEPYREQQGTQAQPVPTDAVSGFAEELARSSVDGELQNLRRESAHLREELARLSEEITRLKAMRHVSPAYNEAVSLAQRGMAAEGIAGHCGISVGEAELVAALARSGSDFERNDKGEVRDERNTDNGNRSHG